MNETTPEPIPTPAEAVAAPAAAPAVEESPVAETAAAESSVDETPAVEAEAAEAADAPAADAPQAADGPDVAAQLKALFPALFTGGHKPLKLRIQADIQERAPGQFTKAQLSAFFRRYTGNTGYLIALTKAKSRFDLDGNEAGELSEEHLAAAKEELTRRRNLKNERINAEREQENLLAQQRRNRAGLLWDFERTTLTVKNFCALKGVSEEELPGLLDIARKERAEAPPRPAREEQRPQQRPGQQRPGQRPDQRNNEQRRDGRPPRGDQQRRGGGGSGESRSTSAPKEGRRNASR